MAPEVDARTAPPTPDDVARASVRVGEPALVDGVLFWLATSPDGSGDAALYAEGPDGPTVRSAPGTSLRSRLYGYGAASWCPTPLGPVGIDARTQALGLVTASGLDPVGAAPAAGGALGDPVALPGTGWVVLVAEGPRPSGAAVTGGAVEPGAVEPGAVEPGAVELGRVELVAVELATGRRTTLLGLDGFCAEPQASHDGATLAWLRWPAGAMPWDAAELWVGELDRGATPALRRPRRLDGGRGSSAGQPTWRPDGSLAYVTEAAGWWQPWSCDDGGVVRRLCTRRAEFQRPRWLTCRWLSALGADGALACVFADADGEHVGVLEPDGELREIAQPCVRVDGLAADRDHLAWVGATTGAQGAVLAATRDGRVTALVLADAPDDAPRPARTSVAHEGVDLDVVVWPPTRRRGSGPAPLVVQVHPGPTGAVDRSYAAVVHLLCAHGYAVAAVDTSGSTAHGRRHRERLLGRFGALDVDEVAAAARHLVDAGVASAGACFVRGTSAGGTTALLALATGTFAGAVAWYPASSLEDDGEGFEAGYLTALTGADGPSRAPLARAAELRGAVLVVQGRDDPIVTVAETERLLAALRAAGVAATLLEVPGEGHGFRTAKGRAAALTAELDFYERTVAGGDPSPRYDAGGPPDPGGQDSP